MTAHAYAATRLFAPLDAPADTPPALARLLAFDDGVAAWSLLVGLDDVCAQIEDGRHGRVHPTAVLEGAVFVHETARIGPHAYVQGPAWFGPGTNVGHAAYVRGGVVAVADVNIGHATEVKHSLLLPEAKAPHFNYVGDSVVGSRVNMGAGVKLANFKADGSEVRGTWIGARSLVYANATVRGVIEADTLVKHKPELAHDARR